VVPVPSEWYERYLESVAHGTIKVLQRYHASDFIMIHFPKVIYCHKAVAFGLVFPCYSKACPFLHSKEFWKIFWGNPIFCLRKIAEAPQKIFKIAWRYLMSRKGHLSFARKNKSDCYCKGQLKTFNCKEVERSNRKENQIKSRNGLIRKGYFH
jgi:hypothetical protein